MSKCFYVPGERNIIDTMTDDGLSSVFKETFEQVKQRHPNAEIWEFEDAWKEVERLSREKYTAALEEIARERFWEMLEILPPMKWRGDSESFTESFMISEGVWGDLHSIFCRIGDRYFEMCDRRSLSHEEICNKCLQLIKGESQCR